MWLRELGSTLYQTGEASSAFAEEALQRTRILDTLSPIDRVSSLYIIILSLNTLYLLYLYVNKGYLSNNGNIVLMRCLLLDIIYLHLNLSLMILPGPNILLILYNSCILCLGKLKV